MVYGFDDNKNCLNTPQLYLKNLSGSISGSAGGSGVLTFSLNIDSSEINDLISSYESGYVMLTFSDTLSVKGMSTSIGSTIIPMNFNSVLSLNYSQTIPLKSQSIFCEVDCKDYSESYIPLFMTSTSDTLINSISFPSYKTFELSGVNYTFQVNIIMSITW